MRRRGEEREECWESAEENRGQGGEVGGAGVVWRGGQREEQVGVMGERVSE